MTYSMTRHERTSPGSSDVVLLDRRDKVAWLTLNRPDVLNAINSEMRQRLTALLQELDRDPSVHAIVLGGAGRSFCAGNDLRESANESIELSERRSEEYLLLYDTVRDTDEATDHPDPRPLHGRGPADFTSRRPADRGQPTQKSA